MKKVLHVGCGHPDPAKLPAAFRDGNWQEVRLDIDADAKPDIVSSMLVMDMIADNSYDALYSSHNLEHLFPHEVPVAVREFARVLTPDGFAVMRMPDLQSVAALIAEDKLEDAAYMSAAGPITPLDMTYGLRVALANGNHYMAHKTGFTQKTLLHYLVANGFAQAQVIRASGFELLGLAYRQLVDEQRQATDRDHYFLR
jgi:predicted SAM-dependent methyltransferase